MKRIIFTLLSFCIVYLNSNAQYCGGSGPSQCTPSGALTQPGLRPVSDSLPPVVNGVNSTTEIQFKNYDTITFAGQLLTIQTLRIDSIENLPAGLCWATNKTNNTFANQEDGCIKVNGTACSPPGQHKLRIIVTVNVGVEIQTNADAAGLKYYVRVKNFGDADTPVDTAQTQANPFIAYGGAQNCVIGISEVASIENSLSIAPNPFNTKTGVSFFSDKSCAMTERITNMIGDAVYSKEIAVKVGDNKSVIEKSSLPAGVYFYSLSDGRNLVTKRLIITE